MSSEHAGTRKWSKIIKSHSNSSKTDNVNTKQVRLPQDLNSISRFNFG